MRGIRAVGHRAGGPPTTRDRRRRVGDEPPRRPGRAVRPIVGSSRSRSAPHLGRRAQRHSDRLLPLVRRRRAQPPLRQNATTATRPLFAQTPVIALPKGDPALVFAASALRCGQNRGGRIVPAECFQLPDGGLVRTVAGVELQWLREATIHRPTVTELNEALTRRGVNEHSAAAVIEWAFRHEVLTIPAL